MQPGPGRGQGDRGPPAQARHRRRRRQPAVPARAHAEAIPVAYPESEREIHGLLEAVRRAAPRAAHPAGGPQGHRPGTLLLKKRLFSSPAAFAHTVAVYLETLSSRTGRPRRSTGDDVPEWLEEFFDDAATYDDEQLAEAEDDALGRAAPAAAGRRPTTRSPCWSGCSGWALAHEAQPDAKARELITYLKAVCRPDGGTGPTSGSWSSPSTATPSLAGRPAAPGGAGRRPAWPCCTAACAPQDEREQLRLAFQADPAEHPVRILLATDAASEGIDLQHHCHRLVNYDIPFNPNRLEQRIGRIDRYGQTHTPEIRHFVGAGWASAVDSYEADLEFLSRVANEGRPDGARTSGSVNAVLADAVQRRMLGEHGRPGRGDREAARPGAAARRVRTSATRCAGCASQLDETVRRARHHPGRGETGGGHRAGAGPAAAAAAVPSTTST